MNGPCTILPHKVMVINFSTTYLQAAGNMNFSCGVQKVSWGYANYENVPKTSIYFINHQCFLKADCSQVAFDKPVIGDVTIKLMLIPVCV